MNILVLGGTYFIGKNLLSKIKEVYKGENIYVLNRGNKIDEKDANINYVIADRNSKESIKENLRKQKYDIVFDISGTNSKHIENIISTIEEDNIGLYIFISSSAVYADTNTIPFEECDLLGENKWWGEYGKNKIECETYINEIHKKSNMNYLILRPPYVYGKWNYIYRESFCFKRSDENRKIIIPGNGKQQIQFIYIDDLCNGVFALINNSQSYNDVYNIGNDIVTFEEWAKKCVQVTHNKVDVIHFDYRKYNLKSRDFFPFYDYNNILDISKLSKYFIPNIKLEEGLKECYEWYQKNKEYIEYRDYEKIESKIISGEIK